ncbi:MAG: hypothetical protein J6Y24_12130 [Bacteroidales bacterium]|nr:hypothetical protein [Bacteroidales bacterium]MBP5503526.1 hypothetical protein [Bacteroidales bacterium]
MELKENTKLQLTELTENEMRQIDGGNPVAIGIAILIGICIIGGCAKEAY